MALHDRERPIVDLARVIDHSDWGAYQRVIVGFTALAIVFDGADNQLLGIAIPSMMQEWRASRAAFAPVVALSTFGMMVGGFLGGLAGDRFGRRTALLASMAVFGAGTLLVGTAGSVAALGALRFAAGLGLGGAMPNATALAGEYVAARHRAFAVTLTIVCVPVGGVLAGLLAAPVLPTLGWRGLFAIGGAAPLIAAALLWRAMPESPRFLATRPERHDELVRLLGRMGCAIDANARIVDPAPQIARAPIAAVLGAEFRRDTIALCVAFFACLLAIYLGFAWLPSILNSAGLGERTASGGLTVFNLGGVVGAIVGGMAIGRFGSRRMMTSMAGAAVLVTGVLSATAINASSNVVEILALLTVCGALINAVQVALFALAAHVYPPSIRATGVGIAVAVGRSGGMAAGYAGPAALEYAGSASFFGLMAASVLAALVAIACVTRHVPTRASMER